jgi:NADPH:quinone reductase-like Zn-dependent oxidoreductase
MRAVGFKEFGDPEVLEVIKLPDVAPGKGEIKVENYASAVNPTDIVSRSGLIKQFIKDFSLPCVPGMDFAGKVKEVGDGVETGIKVGDDVMGMVMPSGTHGAYSDQLILNQFAVVKIPKGVSHVEASTLPMNGLTARLSLDLLNLNKGQIIAVTGGPGAYGGYAIQLAKADGLIVIADSNEQDIDLLKNLGVDHIVPRGKNFVEEIKKIFPEGVDGIADGALLNESAIGAVKDNGSFTSVRNFIGEPQRNINFTATWVSEYNCDLEKLDRLRQQVEDGLISLRVADTVKPENTAEAHRKLDAGGTRGRMVIDWK